MLRPKSTLRTILQPMAMAVLLAVIARAAVHIYSIPSASMVPALEPGDQIVVARYFRSQPARGDVIVFQSPADPNELMVKRVIGLPGERIDSRLGRVRVGGHTLPEPYVLTVASSGAIDAQFVPLGAYFVMGDNRESSLDSRVWGVVPRESVVGRARIVLWSAPHSLGGEAHAGGGDASERQRHSSRARLFKWID